MKKKLSLLILTIFTLYSCSDTGVKPTQTESGFSVVNGRVTFKDKSSATNLINELNQKSEGDLDKWEKNNNFVSLRTIVKKDPSFDPMFEFHSNAIATLLNENHEYQVGKEIIWFNDNYVYTVPDGNEDLFNSIKQDPENIKFSSFRKIFVSALNESSQEQSNVRVVPHQDYYTPIPFKLNGPLYYRFVHTLYNINNGQGLYNLELWNYLQYRSASNGNWYLAGESVDYRAIQVTSIYSENPNFGVYSYTKNVSAINGQLKLLVGQGATPFAGVVTADFTSQIYSQTALITDNATHTFQ